MTCSRRCGAAPAREKVPTMRKPYPLLSFALTFALGCSKAVPDASAARDAGLSSEDAATREVDSIIDPGLLSRDAQAGALEDAAVQPPPPAPDVQVVITTDNAFSFGYGDVERVTTFVQGVASDADHIFDCPVGYGPKPYTVPGASAPDSAYLYVVAWADRAFTQGALAQFKRVGGTPIYSGDGAWQVCATGKEYDPDTTPGPDQATVNRYLEACNAGSQGDTFSRGWVNTQGAVTEGARGKLAFGEANDSPEGDFTVVCQRDDAGVEGIDAAARWMWFDPGDGQSPFVGNDGNRTQSFLIFRLPASAIVLL
jgi:hypothetical protein